MVGALLPTCIANRANLYVSHNDAICANLVPGKARGVTGEVNIGVPGLVPEGTVTVVMYSRPLRMVLLAVGPRRPVRVLP